MKFKSPGSDPVMVSLLSGHTCTVSHEGTEVEPRFRKEAIARGCTPMGVGSEDDSTKREPTKVDLISAGIEKMLEGDDEGAFTGDGKPDVRKLSDVVGFTVTAKERDTAWAVVNDTLKG